MAKFELTAERREQLGKGASRRLRRLADKVPGIIYGGGEPVETLSFDHNKLLHALQNEAFYSHILTIHIDGKAQKAVLKDLQRHPYKPRIQHLDLLRITGKEKINMNVPLHFLGGDVAPGVKEEGGVISHTLSHIEIRCLPNDLPEFIEVDLSNMQLNEIVHLSQLKLPHGVEIVALMHGGDDSSVASLHIPQVIAEEEVTPAVTTEEGAVAETAEGAAAPTETGSAS